MSDESTKAISAASVTFDDEGKIFKGSAVRNGRLIFTSVSQIKMFDKAHEGCPRKWTYHYVLKKKLAKTGVLVKGADLGVLLYKYLTTGQDVLPPVLLPAKKFFPVPGQDLECEKPFATGSQGKGEDLLLAIAAREQLVTGNLTWQQKEALQSDINRYSGLTANGISVDGAADCRHHRGTFIGEDGVLYKEAPGMFVGETVDQKAVSRIHPQVIHSGQNAGQVLQSYVLKGPALCNDVQMLGYGVYDADNRSELTHVRLSHVYANKSKREAQKYTALISVAQLRERWHRVNGVVSEMDAHAGVTKIEDVEPNTNACDSYTHVDPNNPKGPPLQGCGHKYYCPLSSAQVTSNLMGLSSYKENVMSLFDEVPAFAFPSIVPLPPPVPPAPPVPQDAASYAAAVEAEKQRLLASPPAAPPSVVSYGSCPACGEALSDQNASRLQSGAIKHFNCANVAVTAPSSPPAVPTVPTGVRPPDAPTSNNLLDRADPMPAAEIAKVEDPELRAKLEAHAKAHAARELERLAAETAGRPSATVWCPTSTIKVKMTPEIMVLGKYTCQCTKVYTVKVLKPIKEGDDYVSVIPKHKPLKTDETAAPVAPSVPPVPSVPVVEVAAPLVPGPLEQLTMAMVTTPPPVPVVPPVPSHSNGTSNGAMTAHIDELFGKEPVGTNTEVAVPPVPPAAPPAPVAPASEAPAVPRVSAEVKKMFNYVDVLVPTGSDTYRRFTIDGTDPQSMAVLTSINTLLSSIEIK